MLKRREFLSRIAAAFGCFAGVRPMFGAEPWDASEALAPASLAKQIEAGNAPQIVCVAFPPLYRQRLIRGAKLAGPGSKPEGIRDLETLASPWERDSEVVVYCGCCPMNKCPNIRPAYETLKKMGFKKVRVLIIPTNMHSDWTTKGYPSEPPKASETAAD